MSKENVRQIQANLINRQLSEIARKLKGNKRKLHEIAEENRALKELATLLHQLRGRKNHD